jgi:hypothetical protein
VRQAVRRAVRRALWDVAWLDDDRRAEWRSGIIRTIFEFVKVTLHPKRHPKRRPTKAEKAENYRNNIVSASASTTPTVGEHFSPADLLQDLIAAFTLANTRPKGPRRTFEEDEEEQRRRNQRDDQNKRSKVREGVRNRGAGAFVNRVPPDVRERVIVDDRDRRAKELIDRAYEERCATVQLDPTKAL